ERDWERRLQNSYFLYGQEYQAEQAAFYLLAHEARPDLFAVTLRMPDLASHYMARFLPRGQRDPVSYSRLLEPIYRYEHALVGRLLAAAGSEPDVVLISDHGFEQYPDGNYDHKETAPDGIFIAAGKHFRSGVRLESASVYDVMPTLLQLLGLPAAADMPGKVLQ